MWWPVLSACIFLFQDFSTLVKFVQLVTLSHSFNSYKNTFSINVQFLNVENVKINYMEETLFLIPPQGNFSNWWNFDYMIYKFLNLNWSLASSLYKCFSISVKKKKTNKFCVGNISFLTFNYSLYSFIDSLLLSIEITSSVENIYIVSHFLPS